MTGKIIARVRQRQAKADRRREADEQLQLIRSTVHATEAERRQQWEFDRANGMRNALSADSLGAMQPFPDPEPKRDWWRIW